jgi:hypothetical protein
MPSLLGMMGVSLPYRTRLEQAAAEAANHEVLLQMHHRNAASRRMAPTPLEPEQAPRRVTQAPASLMREYKAEYCPSSSTVCVGCTQAMPQGSLRVGWRVAPGGRSGPTGPSGDSSWTWYHTNCMPPGNWRDAASQGVQNMRRLAPADTADLRQRLTEDARRSLARRGWAISGDG